MTTTHIKIVSDDKWTKVFVGDDLIFKCSTHDTLVTPIEGFNSAYGNVLSSIFGSHIGKYGRSLNE